MTTRRSDAFDALRAARMDTLALVEPLDQAALDARPDPERWSVGEVLDHLVRADAMFLREIHGLLAKQRRGRLPITVRGLRDLGLPFGGLPLPLRLPIEGTLAFWNAALPPVLREWAISQRRLRANAPSVLEPERGRRRDALLADLHAGLEEVEHLESAPDIDLDLAVFYSPVVGWSGIPGLVRLIAGHDRRHREQIREGLAALGRQPLTRSDR